MVGDTHANAEWTCRVIDRADRLGVDLVLQLGDFGYWPNFQSGRFFLDMVEECLSEYDISLWFIDGNHEDHMRLKSAERRTEPMPITDHVTYLPRGARWVWGSTRWLAIGGATSVDRLLRTEGVDWFAQEAMSFAQEVAIADAGQTDVVVAHDAPWGVPFLAEHYNLDQPPEIRGGWPPDALRDSDQHMRRMRGLLDAVHPRVWFHGHHHVYYDDVLATTEGTVVIHGLAEDGSKLAAGTLLVDASGAVASKKSKKM